jgi:hypothetical protein
MSASVAFHAAVSYSASIWPLSVIAASSATDGFGAALADTPMTNNTTATNRLFAGFPLDLLATYTELSVTGFIFPNGCVADRFLPVEHRRRLLVPRRPVA